MIGYLDIETSFTGELTVFGLLRLDRGLLQLVGDAVTKESVAQALDRIDTICTFNGERFDLPVLDRALGLDLLAGYRSLDLFVECARLGVRGGLKAIEAWYGISRRSHGVTGYDAMVLWDRGDTASVELLLDYNREDVLNLVSLERRLHGDLCAVPAVERLVVGA